MADNALRLAEEQHRLEAEGGSFLGLDEGFTADIDSVVAEGKFVSADDLRQMIEMFLQLPTLGGHITADSKHSGVHRLRLNKDGRGELLKKLRSLNLKQSDRSTLAFTRWLEGNEPHWPLTFDQKMALEQREIPFITPIHPLARVAISHWATIDEPLVTQVAIYDNTVPPGQYLFVCDLWETVAVRPEVRLVGNAWNLDKLCVAPEVSAALVRLLSHAIQPAEYINFPNSLVDTAIQQLEETVHQYGLDELDKLRDKNKTLLNRKIVSLDAYYKNRIQRLENELNQAKEERIIRMKESERSRIQRDYESKRSDLENRREADIITQRVAVGILLVQGAVTNG
jgi:hypothetical protein